MGLEVTALQTVIVVAGAIKAVPSFLFRVYSCGHESAAKSAKTFFVLYE